ncbi:hypothetical protein BpHYR1_015348 [Brachionus plicatilis]|uniref:Uncharacterized protein n=1 Tax=Brachionus plicatilis TaxID=10195 RepID=A0A3M7T5K3_BRAPC|nr:hypothetical protein BpHYR1_015348 [Brachionus plicatilis]
MYLFDRQKSLVYFQIDTEQNFNNSQPSQNFMIAKFILQIKAYFYLFRQKSYFHTRNSYKKQLSTLFN